MMMMMLMTNKNNDDSMNLKTVIFLLNFLSVFFRANVGVTLEPTVDWWGYVKLQIGPLSYWKFFSFMYIYLGYLIGSSR